MSAVKKATIKSSTFWVNAIFATAGAALVKAPDLVQAAGDQASATITVTPETIGVLASLLGTPVSPPVMGAITIVMALTNQLLRYKTQRKLEKQLDTY